MAATRTSYRGLMVDNETRRVFLTSSLFLSLVLVAVMAEKPASHRYEVGNGSRVFSARVLISMYSIDAFIQKDVNGVD